MSNLFRKKSMDRIASPEQLNDYIRVSTPSVWLVLAAIVVLLVGVCVWGVFGRMETAMPAVALAQNGTVMAYVRAEDAQKVSQGAAVTVGENTGSVQSVAAEPVRVAASFSEYMRHVGGLQEGEWVYAVTLDVACADGVYAAEIVIDSVSPMSFVLN